VHTVRIAIAVSLDEVCALSYPEDEGCASEQKERPIQRTMTPILIERTDAMLYTIAVMLLLLWALGLVTSYTLGGFIHVLLVIAVVMVLLRVINGRAVV
jgi:hypothetical protein